MSQSLKVTYVRFHNSDNYIPGVGTIGNVLPAQNKTFDSLNMYYSEQTLYVEIQHKGIKVNVLFPAGAISSATYASVAPKAE